MYRRDTTRRENGVANVIRSALEYNKYEAQRWRVSVEMIPAVGRRITQPGTFNKSPVVRTSVE